MGLKPFGLTFANPDFVTLAQSFGAHGHRIAATAELAPLLKQLVTEKGVHIIDCPVDYRENGPMLGAKLKEEVRRIQL